MESRLRNDVFGLGVLKYEIPPNSTPVSSSSVPSRNQLSDPVPMSMAKAGATISDSSSRRRQSQEINANNCFTLPEFPDELGEIDFDLREDSNAKLSCTKITRSLRVIPISRFWIRTLYRENSDGVSHGLSEEAALFRAFMLFHTFWHYAIPAGAWAWVVYTTAYKITGI